MLDAVKLTPIQAVNEVLRYALVDVASKRVCGIIIWAINNWRPPKKTELASVFGVKLCFNCKTLF